MKPTSRSRRTITGVAAVGLVTLAGLGAAMVSQSTAQAAGGNSSQVSFTVRNSPDIRSVDVNGECKSSSPVYQVPAGMQVNTNAYTSSDCSGTPVKTCTTQLPTDYPAYGSFYIDTCQWRTPETDPSTTETATPTPPGTSPA